jgi:predicted ArsR family transcriptional regulator
MEEERMELSARERERLKVLHELEEGHVRQREAAHRLRLSTRQVRRLLVRLRAAAPMPISRSASTAGTGCVFAAGTCGQA